MDPLNYRCSRPCDRGDGGDVVAWWRATLLGEMGECAVGATAVIGAKEGELRNKGIKRYSH